MIIVAPDKFKGTLTAASVASVVAEELRALNPQRTVAELPIADGGDGTVDLAIRSGMDRVTVTVAGPMGHPVVAAYARDEDVAVIEMAAAAGLERLPSGPDASTAARSSTYGVGQLMVNAIAAGARTLVVGLGGSASTDGGAGLVSALGARLNDEAAQPIEPGGAGLGAVASLDLDPMLRLLDGIEVILASDVDNPLNGPDGAAAVYGSQKGADADLIELLDRNLVRWAELLHRETKVDVTNLAGAGAAGGTGSALLATGCARIESGVETMLKLIGFDEQIKTADLVVVGEGALDEQSLRGKGPVGVARAAKAYGAEVVAVVGTSSLGPRELDRASIDRVYAMTDVEPDPHRCMENAEPVLRQLASRLAAAEVGRGE